MNKFQMTREMPKVWRTHSRDTTGTGTVQASIHPLGRRGRLLDDATTKLYGRPPKKKVKK